MTYRKAAVPADHFTIVSNAWARDERLSWKARGLLLYLSSHSVNWQTTQERLQEVAPDGASSLASGLAELKEHGYLTVSRARDEKGQLGGTNFDLVDPFQGNPASDNPGVGNPPPKKTISKKTKEHSQESLVPEVESVDQQATRIAGVLCDQKPSWSKRTVKASVLGQLKDGTPEEAIIDAALKVIRERKMPTLTPGVLAYALAGPRVRGPGRPAQVSYNPNSDLPIIR